MPPRYAPPVTNTALRKTLGPIALWGLGVGYVISGEYFGWNLGLPLAGTYGMLAATLVVTVMYAAFVPSYAELACAMPSAGGAFVYAERAFGPRIGAVAGFAQAIEFVFAPPAIAMAIAAYVSQGHPSLEPRAVAALAYVAFTGLNAWGVRQAARFELVVTLLAVIELLIFVAVALPAFDGAAFTRDALPHGWAGAFHGLPFAIWFYLAIEGLANAAEEARDPQRDLAFGFAAAMATLGALAIAVFFASVGVAGWHSVVFPEGSTTPSDAPLPLALLHVVGRDSPLYTLLLGIGLLGLVASFHGILLAAARATMALGRAGLAPARLAEVHAASATPRFALAVNLGLGLAAIATGKTAEIIVLSVFGALTLYVLSLLSFFRLRAREPDLDRPFRAPFHPVAPGVALAIAVVCLASLTLDAPRILAVYLALLSICTLYAGRRLRDGHAPRSE